MYSVHVLHPPHLAPAKQEKDYCRELTTLWVVRLDDGAELKVTDPEEQQRDVEEEEAEG